MKSSKLPRARHDLTSHGIIILATGTILVLLWRATGGAGTATTIGGIILLLLVLRNYDTIITQLEGV